ncbi:hypothetical protein GCM10010294_33910 [Streptomyces griseoloalbus]|nr:hypothetical protein GCM10010294_33910 [Streptomyces griseoloalbus]
MADDTPEVSEYPSVITEGCRRSGRAGTFRYAGSRGVQSAALQEVFTECAEQLPEARRQIKDGKYRLDLPLGMRTEYDR